MNGELAVRNETLGHIAPQSFAEVGMLSEALAKSSVVPQQYRGKPSDIMAAVMYGMEHGLAPLTSLISIAVINGRPAFYGDAVPGMALKRGLITDMREWIDGEGDKMVAYCEVIKPNGSKVQQFFSVADAKRAGLWDKAGPWKQYPRRMLQWRARSWAIRDAAPQAVFGPTLEELKYGDEYHIGPERAKDVSPAAPQAFGVARFATPAGQAGSRVYMMYDPWGAEYQVDPDDIGAWIANAVDGASAEELEALETNNPDRADVAEAVEAERVRRTGGENTPPPSGEHAQSPASGADEKAAEPAATTAAGEPQKLTKSLAQQIAQAMKEAPNVKALDGIWKRRKELIVSTGTESAIMTLRGIYDDTRADLVRVHGEPEAENPFDDDIAEIEGEEWKRAEEHVEDERQQELLR